jgi:Tfp pilus assembly PilM family ATPase
MEGSMKEVIHKEDRVFLGYTREELSKAFDKVANPDNWKDEIEATIPASDFDIVNSAVIFFTGGGLESVKQF